MEIPFVGGAYTGRSTNLNAQTCQNWYLESDQQEGKSQKALINTPGMLLWCATGTVAGVRGLHVWKDHIYAVVGATLYKIDVEGTKTAVGTLLTSTGKVFMAGGTTHLCLVDGFYGYYRLAAATSLTTITDADFPVPTSLTYQDGYFIVTQKNTDAFFISASENAASWDGLDFASAEDTPDDALVVISHNRELWIFGEDTTEVFYNSGDTDFPFSRVSGGVFPVGISAPNSVVSSYEGLFALDNKHQVMMIVGYQRQIISTPQIQFQIQTYATKSDAIGYTYTQEGHSFYVLTFPGASKTWVYDISTGVWHTRSSGLGGGRHRSNCCVWFNGKNIVGDCYDGNLYELDMDTYTDGSETIKRVRAAQVIHSDRKRMFHSQLEVEFEAGVGLVTGQGSDPKVMLDWSDDGGHTWGNEHWTGIGKIGEYKNRAVWRRLGASRERIYRVAVTDPIKAVIIGAHLEAVAGNA